VKDILVVIALILSFALMITAHVAITYGLAKRPPRWRAVVGFFVMPLAWGWAYREQMRVRLWIGLGALALYIAATVIARL
jgi:hypothetical protein